MKKALLILALAVGSAFTASAQLLNGGFENWTGNTPDNWTVERGVTQKVSSVSYTVNGQQRTKPVWDGQFALNLNNSDTTLALISQQFGLTTKPRYFSGTMGYFAGIMGERALVELFFYNSSTRDTVLYQIFQLPANFVEPFATFNVDMLNLYRSGTGDSARIRITTSQTVVIDGQNRFGLATTLFLGSVRLQDQPFVDITEEQLKRTSVSAYPNPTTGNSIISYSLNNASNVNLTVYDLNGREVARLVDGMQPAGSHNARFDASNLEKGMYIFRLKAGEVVETGKIMVSE